MKLSPRESILAVVMVMAILSGGTFIVLKPKVTEWKEFRRQRLVAVTAVAKERRLLASRGEWETRYAELKKMLPEFGPEKQMDVHWLTAIEAAAAKHGVVISKRQAGEEKKMGDVFELPVECKELEGSLTALVGFLFDLQNQGAMLDVRQILLRPKELDVLRGRLTVYCAYTRTETGAPGGASSTVEKK